MNVNNIRQNFSFSLSLKNFSLSKKTRSNLAKITLASLPILTSFLFDLNSAIEFKFDPTLWISTKVSSGLVGFYLTTGTIALLHELSHAKTGELFFKNANPKIDFDWFSIEASTDMDISTLTPLGKRLGFHKSCVLYTLAGPALEATIEIGLSVLSPENSTYKLSSLIHSLGLFVYLSSSFFEKPRTYLRFVDGTRYSEIDTDNDYLRIKHHGGIKPFLAISGYTLAAVYICATSFFNTFTSELASLSFF